MWSRRRKSPDCGLSGEQPPPRLHPICARTDPPTTPRSKGFGPTLVATNLLVWPSTETDDQFTFHGFGNLEKGEDLPADTGGEEPAAKRHRGDASTAATDGGTVFGGDGAAIE